MNKKYARVLDGLVIEVVSTHDYDFNEGTEEEPKMVVKTWDIKDMFHPSLAIQFVECPAETEIGWTFDGNSFTAPAQA